jgi:hypothetical protein
MDTEERLRQIKERVAKATPAPWYVNYLDDSYFMNLRVVTTRPDSGKHEALVSSDDPETKEIRDSIVASTLLQAHIADGKPFVEVNLENPDDTDTDGYPKYNQWDEDAEFIAHARADIEWLLSLLQDQL